MKKTPKFKAVFNPFTNELCVLYGNCLTYYTFEVQDEWVCISENGDTENPNYLHTHLHYDESLQLLFYPRVDNDESLNETFGVYFNSIDMKKVPKQIKLAYNQKQWDAEIEKFYINNPKVNLNYIK